MSYREKEGSLRAIQKRKWTGVSEKSSEESLKGALPLLALLTAFPPLSTDMILPALPSLAENWGQPLSVINLVLVGFFGTYGFFLLFYGPVSDRFGRRPPLLFGLAIYVFASFCCAVSSGASMLIAFRVLQAAGAAASSSLSMAMTRDIYSGADRERVLAHIAVIMALAPMLAPVFGGWLLAYLSWPWIFFTQAFMGILGILGVLRFPETLPEASEVPLSKIMHAYGRLLLNPSYIVMVLVMSVSLFPLYSFISASSYIYINDFGLSEQKYSYFFAFNALALMIGSFSCLRFTRSFYSRRFGSRHLMTAGFAGILLGGGLLFLFAGNYGPWSFALPMFLITFFQGLSRPPSNNLVLEQVETDVGAASSLLIFTYFTLGAIGMWLISLEWESKIQVLGAIALACGGLVLSAWMVLWKKV